MQHFNFAIFIAVALSIFTVTTHAQAESAVDKILSAYSGPAQTQDIDHTAISDGLKELREAYIADGDTEAEATEYAIEALSRFMMGQGRGGVADSIAEYAPKLTQYILTHKDLFEWNALIQLDTAVKEAQTKALRNLLKTLSGGTSE